MREDLEEKKILAKLYLIIALTTIFDLLTAFLIALALNSKRYFFVSLFAIPQVLSAFSTRDLTFHMIESVKLYTVRPINTIISTIIGFFAGLVPGLTTELSSLMAYSLATLRRFSPIDKIVNFNSEVENKTFYYSDILIFNKYNCMNKIVF